MSLTLGVKMMSTPSMNDSKAVMIGQDRDGESVTEMFQQFPTNVLVSVNQNLQDSTVYGFAGLPYPLVLESCHVNCFRPDGSTGNRLKQGFQCEIASHFIKISGFGISGDGLPAATLKKWCTDLNRDFYVQEGHDV